MDRKNETLKRRKSIRPGQFSQPLADTFARFCGLFCIGVVLVILAVLVFESWLFFKQVPLSSFFFEKEWQPFWEPMSFGIAPLVCGTFLIFTIAAIISFPLGVLIAMFSVFFAPHWMRGSIKFLLELLSGIPSVVFGFFALTLVTPTLQRWVPTLGFFNALSAGIAVALMLLPLVASVSAEALRQVPRSLIDGGLALGARRHETIRGIALPYAKSGIVASFILAFSRAIGETMAVTLAAGSTPVITFDPRESIQTMTAFIVQASMGESEHTSVTFNSIFAVGLMLFAVSFLMNGLAYHIVQKKPLKQTRWGLRKGGSAV